MNRVWGDIYGIKVSDLMRLFSDSHPALTSGADNHMLMPVLFEAAVTARRNLKIP
jgi:hypothetical protein